MAWPDFVSPSLLNYVYVPAEIKIYLPLPFVYVCISVCLFVCVCESVCVSFIAYPIKNKIAAYALHATLCHTVFQGLASSST